MPFSPKREFARLSAAVQGSVDTALSPIRRRASSGAERTTPEMNALRDRMGTALPEGEKRQRAAQGLAVSYILLYRYFHRTESSRIEKWVHDYMPRDIKHNWMETASNLDLWFFRTTDGTIQRPPLTPKVNEIFNRFYTCGSDQQKSKCRSFSRDFLDVAVKAVKRGGSGVTILQDICDAVEPRDPLYDLPEDSGPDGDDDALARNGIHMQVS
nr:hypothetical protein CFP56_43761 [Quercus suber]